MDASLRWAGEASGVYGYVEWRVEHGVELDRDDDVAVFVTLRCELPQE